MPKIKPVLKKKEDALKLVERERHAESEGEVRLKSDTEYWATSQNDPEIGRFNVPWSPFGFHSGMGLEDVRREEADDLGVTILESKPVKPWKMNDNLQSSVKKISPEIKQKLIDEKK